MSTATTSLPDPAPGSPSVSRAWLGRTPGTRNRFTGGGRIPYLVVGVLLVVVCTAGVVLTIVQVSQRTPVLALARPVGVGQVLAAGDLRQVSVSMDASLDVLPASRVQAVLGKPVAYSLPAGTLLSAAAVGTPQDPPQGQGVVAVAAQPGQFPPELAPGTTVSIIVVQGGTGNVGLAAGSIPGGPWTGVVAGVSPMAGDQITVVSLQLPAPAARQIAAIPAGQLSIVAESAGGR
ncbi:MAG TPA: SAF domain-containing protein [Pseudonocardiaceae bacterium]|jgi:hypothetical protein|nr:SAF domain-containing protein [Pseudonocardiaceae bacterium]